MAIRILIVEDDASIALLLDYNLRTEGFEVVTAASAEEGELLLSEQLFDLLILDWMLPEMSGIDFCKKVRRLGKVPSLPILMLTARSEEADRVRGLAVFKRQ